MPPLFLSQNYVKNKTAYIKSFTFYVKQYTFFGMNKNQLENSLKSQIERTLAFFREPPAGICARHSLTFRDPISILIGPDVETRFTKNGVNILKNRTTETDENLLWPLIHKVRKAMKAEKLIARTDGFEIDGQRLEHKLIPSDPLTSCDIFLRAKQFLEELAAQEGMNAQVGNGHTHMSFAQNGQDLFYDQKSGFTDFFRTTLQGLYDFQTALPAFFIKPARAETAHSPYSYAGHNTPYKGPRYLCYHRTFGLASLRAKFHVDTDAFTIEGRLTKHAPLSPLALHLTAAKHGLEDTGAPWTGSQHSYKKWSSKQINDSASVSLDQQHNLRTQRGPGGYLNMLQETFENLRRHNPFLPGLAENLLYLSIEEYRTYLDRPTGQTRYTPEELQKLREKITVLETKISTEFTIQTAPTPDKPEFAMIG